MESDRCGLRSWVCAAIVDVDVFITDKSIDDAALAWIGALLSILFWILLYAKMLY